MATLSNDAEDKIKQTLIRLADGEGYHPRKLFSAPMLDLFPRDWPQLTQAAACDELIREFEPHIENDNHAAALQAALNIGRVYSDSTLTDRLVAFRRRWHQDHPKPPPEIDLANRKSTYDATRKWWEAGRNRLTRSLNAEIERRNRTGQWPEPRHETLERIEAALVTDSREDEAEPQPAPPRRPRASLLRRALIMLSSVLVVVILVGIWVLHGGYHFGWVWVYRITSAARCSDIGNRDRATPEPIWSGPFRAAYERAGGKVILGCPRTDDPSGYVHQWAAGWSQDLQGGRVGIARIVALDPQHVIVMAGSYWHDYTDQGNGQPNSDAAQQRGYPTSNPVACGPARLVLLAQSQEGESPGAMVTDVHHAHFIWLPKLIWTIYQATGGPFGRLGLPIGGEQSTPTGQLQRFQHGYILLTGGVARTDLQQAGHREPANPHAVTQLARCIALAR